MTAQAHPGRAFNTLCGCGRFRVAMFRHGWGVLMLCPECDGESVDVALRHGGR